MDLFFHTQWSEIRIAIVTLWFFGALMDYSYFVYLWQLKEYRGDRMKDFFSTNQGKIFAWGYRFLWRTILVVASFTLLKDEINEFYIVFSLLSIDTIFQLKEVVYKKFRHPVFTPKAFIIGFVGITFEMLVVIFTRSINFILFYLVFRFAIISVIVSVFNFFTTLIKKIYIKLATKKMSRYKNLLVIGITGSYGKSSVKEFLSHILKHEFSVKKTPKNTNTEIGIAKFILKNNFEKDDIFVVEMGAYKIGEIKLICDMVKPKIGILTSINEQHLSLFGSLKNIQTAKCELLRALPKDGLGVTNAEISLCTEYKDEFLAPLKTFGSDEENRPDCLIKDIKITLDGIYCIGVVNGTEGKIFAPVTGAHQAYNIAPAIIVASHLGMKKEKIIDSIKTLPSEHGSIKMKKYGKSMIIDDSYNSNPKGFSAALDIFNLFSSDKKRIVITRGMLELGEKSDELHEQIAGEIAYVADELVIISKDSEEAMRKGAVGKFKLDILVKRNPKDILEYLKLQKKRNTVILLENRMPSVIHDEINKEVK